MLKYCTDDEKLKTRALYEEAFYEDSQSFIDYYYKEKLKDNKIIIDIEDGKIRAMAHLNSYLLNIRDKKTDIDYIVAVATGKDYRRKGLMRTIINKFLNDMYDDKKPFTFLLPANRAYYEPFGFVFVSDFENKEFNELGKSLDCDIYEDSDKKKVIDFLNDALKKEYDVFCIRNDRYFDRLLKELYSEDGYIEIYKDINKKIKAIKVYWGKEKKELREFISYKEYIDIRSADKPAFMARIVNLYEFAKYFRLKKDSEHESLTYLITIKDEIIKENNGTFYWKITKETSRFERTVPCSDAVEFDISRLTGLLFGYEKPEDSFKLMDIDALSGVFFDEVV